MHPEFGNQVRLDVHLVAQQRRWLQVGDPRKPLIHQVVAYRQLGGFDVRPLVERGENGPHVSIGVRLGSEPGLLSLSALSPFKKSTAALQAGFDWSLLYPVAGSTL